MVLNFKPLSQTIFNNIELDFFFNTGIEFFQYRILRVQQWDISNGRRGDLTAQQRNTETMHFTAIKRGSCTQPQPGNKWGLETGQGAVAKWDFSNGIFQWHIRHFECKRAMASQDLPRNTVQDESWDMETTRCTGTMDCHNGSFKNKACSHTATIAIYSNTWSENLQTHIFILLFFRV